MKKDQHTSEENFLTRWSRLKKSDVEKIEEISSSEDLCDEKLGSSVTESVTDQGNQGDENKPALTDADMPPLDSLDATSDYSGFLSPEVSESLRRAALRKLFHQPAFNITDQLDDYDEDFTRFIPLGNLVTADMKHQLEQKAKEHFEQLLEEQEVEPATLLQARQQALDSLPPLPEVVNTVFYQSHGRVIVIGGMDAVEVMAAMPESLQAHCLLTEAGCISMPTGTPHKVTGISGEDLDLKGYLGAFELKAVDINGAKQIFEADLVLDLQEEALLDMDCPPPGYLRMGDNKLADVIASLPEWVGAFSKPRYFQYDPDICVHSSSGLSACRNCIEACPAEAVISVGDRVEINPNLCQGGGACSTACPSGAVRYDYPEPAQQHDRLRRLLHAYREAGGVLPKILLYRSEHELSTDQLAANILPFPLEELASIGPEGWFAALSFGANQVLLLDEKQTPKTVRHTLETQLQTAHALLEGFSYPKEAIQLIQPGLPEQAISPKAVMPVIQPATQAGLNTKREQWFLALDHLYQQAAVEVPESVPLPEGAPFGLLAVDQAACTLCMACTTVCPLQAVSGGVDQPQLRFYSNRCVQCGLCEQGCPENAISLVPQFITDAQQRRNTHLLYEDEPFRCISCQKPFATKRLIDQMLDKLSGHPMFQSECALKRLKMCEDCRVVDAVQDDAAMGLGMEIKPGGSASVDKNSSGLPL